MLTERVLFGKGVLLRPTKSSRLNASVYFNFDYEWNVLLVRIAGWEGG